MNFTRTLLAAALLITGVSACKKDDDAAQPGAGGDIQYFSSGHGFRYLNSITANDGSTRFMSFKSCDLSVSSDGKIHWCVDRSYTFGNSRIPSRFTIDPASGDTLKVSGKQPDALVPNYQWGVNPYDQNGLDRLLFKPYSGELYLSFKSSNYVFSAGGDVPRFDYLDASFNRHPRIYANGDVSMSFFEQASVSLAHTTSRIRTFLWHNGQQIIGAGHTREMWTYNNQNIDSLWHGGIGFPAGTGGQTLAATLDYHAVYLMDETKEIVSAVPFKGQPFALNSAANTANIEWSVKTSADMSKAVLLCRDEDRVNGGFYYSTFFVDNNARSISVGVNAVRIMNQMAMDFDLAGNIIYASCPACDNDPEAAVKIITVSPGGAQKTTAENFIGRQLVSGLYARAGKVYLAVNSLAQDPYGSNVARITLFVSE